MGTNNKNKSTDKYYTNERNVQIVIYLLKAYGIKKIIASPGTTNLTFVGSIQQDPFFEIFSSVDERSAAYIACGMAAESGEPVVLTCTGATASRNYYPGLTEAFYRKLPIIALTSTQDPSRIGHNIAQVIDRRNHANDVVVLSEQIQFITKPSDEFDVTIKVNKAMHALRHNGGGPIHLNIETTYSRDFSVKELPTARFIKYFGAYDKFPIMPEGKIGIFVGNHSPMTESLTRAIDRFCATNDAVVFCDQTSNYKGKFRVLSALIGVQDNYKSDLCEIDLLIHIGEVSGGNELMSSFSSKQQWRISEDGKTCDTFKNLTAVFQVPEEQFFTYYINDEVEDTDVFSKLCQAEYLMAIKRFPEIPFSNIWIAKNTASRLPEKSVLHLGILNSLRSWNYFETPLSVYGFSNTGGFGIDGNISSVVGASLASPHKLFFLILGDLAFFYDLNVLGNRHVRNNIRIMLINNGKGIEFRHPYHPCNNFGDTADCFMAAAGHYGKQSSNLIKNFATDLGYEYLTASNKEDYLLISERFLNPEPSEKPIILEVFTQMEDEQEAINAVHNILTDEKLMLKRYIKQLIKKLIPKQVITIVNKIIK